MNPDVPAEPLTDAPSPAGEALRGERVLVAGRLAGMTRKDARRRIEAAAGSWAERYDAEVTLVVVGDEGLPLADGGHLSEHLEPAVQAALARGSTRVCPESSLWERLGLVETEDSGRRLYTPAMLADLLGIPTAVVRRWHRRGLLVPSREVRRLPYFDFQEVTTAKRLAELMTGGASPQLLEKNLKLLRKWLPRVERPLAQLSVLVEGKQLFLRQGDGLVEPGGQRRFDFDSEHPAEPNRNEPPAVRLFPGAMTPGIARFPVPAETRPDQPSWEELADHGADLEDRGELPAAAEAYRAAMAAGGPKAHICFALAEVLYRQGDPSGARERYYTALELDEDYVEARCNLGCVLTELGDLDLAAAAFEGALAYHPDYPDPHFHLARLLDQTGRGDRAEIHWERFLELAPTSPWADQARIRLGAERPDPE